MDIIIVYSFYEEIKNDQNNHPITNQYDLIINCNENVNNIYIDQIFEFKSKSKPFQKIATISAGRIINFAENRNGLYGKYKITEINIEHILKSKSMEIRLYINLGRINESNK